jgi:hypothetical protein
MRQWQGMPVQALPAQGMALQALPVQGMSAHAIPLQAMPHHGGHRFRDFIIVVLMVVITRLLFFK